MDDLDRHIESLSKCEIIPESAVKELCNKAREILIEESNVQPVQAPVTIRTIDRKQEVPHDGAMCDLLWSDPDGDHKHASEESKMLGAVAELNSKAIRFTKFKNILDLPNIDLEQLKKLSWMGIPEEIRPSVWKLLLGYLPANSDRREATLQRKRKEYEEFIEQTQGTPIDQALQHQIHIDIQRTNAGIPLYQNKTIQESLERILYCWAIRHPASGYVQGINDLVTPYFQVFLQSNVSDDVEKTDVAKVPKNVIAEVEADSFWCLSKLLDGIQDNYTHAQPGIQRQIGRLRELINRIDTPLFNHLQAQGVEFIQFAFRWMNCLLMREISLKNTIRMWDSYHAEGSEGFSEFHLYVCAAFLVKWSDQLKKMDFQGIMMFLQSVPTNTWDEKDIELLLSEAFMWKSLFHNAQSHLAGAQNRM
ncbi:GTPase-activating protein [Chytridiales sp. JEL 0842]|nr:GTPase-activating protein [Chytridiales sp. JEL 0842]